MSFKIQRGTNISHWLSQSPERGEKRRQRFTREDVIRLKDIGCDHLRLPVDEDQMWDENNAKEPEAWDLLNQGLDWCREADLRAIVDLHILRSHHFVDEGGANSLFTDPAESERLGQCWRELACELRNRSNDWVAYELMNEAIADDPEDWNRVLKIPYNVIRENEPERLIAIGSNKWCQLPTFPYFKVPENDPNIFLVFHFYNPMLITHYQAPWCSQTRDYAGPIQYPGQPVPPEVLSTLEPEIRAKVENSNDSYDINSMAQALSPALEMAERLNLKLWCNEFGVINKAPDDVRKKWYQDFIAVLDKHNIAWSNWDFRGEFGLYDGNNDPTVVVESLGLNS